MYLVPPLIESPDTTVAAPQGKVYIKSKFDYNILLDLAVPEMRTSLRLAQKFFLGPVTGPNGIMVAQTFCDMFFYEKKTSDINILTVFRLIVFFYQYH